MEHDSENVGCGLPNFLSDPVFRTLFLVDFDNVVPGAVEILLHDVQGFMLKVLFTFLDDGMADFPRLVSCARADVQRIVQKIHKNTADVLHAILESERASVLTLDESGYERLLKEMQDVAGQGGPEQDTSEIWLFAAVGIKRAEVAQIGHVLRDNPRIFHMQTSLAAYSKLVYRQLYDRIAKLCKLTFQTYLRKEIYETLLSKDIDFIRTNMQQDPKLVRERQHLEASIKRLEACLVKIDAL